MDAVRRYMLSRQGQLDMNDKTEQETKDGLELVVLMAGMYN
jgi:hypothetical protein